MPSASLIEIQEAYIARVAAAHGKITSRTKGNRFNRTRAAARNDAIRLLTRRGFEETSARLIVKDAHDMFLLELNAQED